MIKISKDQGQLTVAATFCLYALEEINNSGNELKTVNLQTKVILLPNMRARIWLLPLFEKKKNRVYIQNVDTIDSGGRLKK